jgi:hypothetical protein
MTEKKGEEEEEYLYGQFRDKAQTISKQFAVRTRPAGFASVALGIISCSSERYQYLQMIKMACFHSCSNTYNLRCLLEKLPLS